MKRKLTTKITAMLLVLVMAVSLCACGSSSADKNGSKTGTEETPAYVYSADFQTILTGSERSFEPRGFTANGLYATSYEKVGEDIPEGATVEYEGQYDVYQYKLYFIDFSGSVNELVNYKPMESGNSENAGKTNYYCGSGINGFGVTNDGKLVTIEDVYEAWYEGPEDLTQDDDEYWNYQKNTDTIYIRTFDQNGTELSCAPVEVGENEYLNAYGLVIDNDGNAVVSTDDGVRVIGADGSDVMNISSGDNGYINSIVKLADGRIAAETYGESGLELWIIDEASKSFGETISMPNDAYSIYTGGGDYDIYYTSGVNFYGMKFDTGESTKLFSWINCDINSDTVSSLAINDDGSVVCLINDYDSVDEAYTINVATVSLVPYDSVPHKETITLATQYLGWDMRSQIINFNRKNDQYRIEVIDYSEYNTEDDYSAGRTKLTTELLAGNTPDIIDLNGMPYTQLAAKGLLEDLYPYIDNDSEFGRDDLFPNVLKALEVNGGMYSTCSSFYLVTAIGAASVVGDAPGWTYEQFNEALASMPEGCEPFDQYTTRDSILQICLNLDMNDFVDWSTGKCNFDSDEFKQLLEFANQFPETFDWENYEYTDDDSTENRIAQGKQMLMTGSIYSINDIFYNDIYFGGDSTYIGFPTYDGRSGSLIGTDSGYAMSSKSEHKDAVWQFLRTFFTEDGQKNIYSIPTNINVYNKNLKEAMTPQYEKNADGSYKLDEDGNKIEVSRGGYGTASGKTVEFYSLSQEQADKLWNILTSTTALYDFSSNSIFEIVSEQSQAYFAGQKSVDEVAKLVQSKANIYVNEQR